MCQVLCVTVSCYHRSSEATVTVLRFTVLSMETELVAPLHFFFFFFTFRSSQLSRRVGVSSQSSHSSCQCL